MEKPVIMFPDFKGTVSRSPDTSEFIQRVKAAVPNAILVSVLNGPDFDDLHAITVAGKCHQYGIIPIISQDPRGLLGALVTGYQYAKDIFHGRRVVRLDPTEHPPERIPEVLQLLEEHPFVIGDLDFSAGGHLVPGTHDEFIHQRLFPSLYSLVTHGKLALSCAHGLQAFRDGSVLKPILRNAMHIINSIDHEEGELVTWGFDGAMALGGLAARCVPYVHPIPSMSLRNRPTDHINRQTDNALRMMFAARKAFPDTF